MNTELLYTLGIAAIIVLVAIAVIALVTSLLRQRRAERSRPQWEDLYPEDRAEPRSDSPAAAEPSSAPTAEAAPESPYYRETPASTAAPTPTAAAAPAAPATVAPRAAAPTPDAAPAAEPRSPYASSPAPPAATPAASPSIDETPLKSTPAAEVQRPFGDDDSDDGGFSLDDLLASPDRPTRSPGTGAKPGGDLNMDLSGLDNLPGDGAPAPSPVAPADPSEQSERLDSLRQTVADEERSPAIRLAAFNKLLQSSERDDQLQGILTAINANHLSLQMRALEEIERRGDDALLDEAIPLLESEHESVALGAVKALQNIGGPIAVQALLAGLESPHSRVRTSIIAALSDLKSNVVEERLLDMSNDDRTSRWTVALEALADVGGAIGLEGLKSLKAITPPLDDKSPAIDEAIRQIELRIGPGGGTSEYPSFSTQGGAGSVAVSMPEDDDDEFAVSLDPALFNQSKSSD